MSDCDLQLLSAYIDGELLPADRDHLEAHLRNCPDCARELDQLRDISGSLRAYDFQELDARELSRVHQAIDQAADQPILRIGLALSAIAASILVVGSAWLVELPSRSTIASTPALSSAPWEQMAMTLSPGPLVQSGGDEIQLARADFTDWMLDSLRK
jgi:anti-sigma factor RsiW